MQDGTTDDAPPEGAPAGRRPSDRQLLTVDIDTHGADVLATVRGELDESTAPTFIARVQGAAGGRHHVVVDLHGLTFCGSAGLSALIVLHRSVTGDGGTLAVSRPTVFVTELLQMAGLDDLIAR